MTRIFALSAALLAAAAVGIASYAVATKSDPRTVVREVTVSGGTPTASTTTAAASVTGVYQSASKGVVEITVSTNSSPYGGQAQAQGSGFVYDGSGHVITNEHVVEGANSISVQFWNGATYKASLVGTDPSTDVAVIKVNAPTSMLHPISLGNSSALQVGQPVVAIGSPYGLEETVTSGVVSALHREMTAPNNFTIADSIQTDAAINHGNSGGPLLNLSGQVIGITSQIKSDSGENTGIGFAVPSNTVRSIVTQLLTNGNVRHAYLGVGIATAQSGVQLTEVRPGTPAANAGLQSGDVITRIDGHKVTTASELGQAIDARRPGSTVVLTYLRDGSTHTVSVKLGLRPS
ncbi:MAG TPA: trypsin-like peptidase domain-containing protein [Gaiellaceae bacterium]|nr:trypsin-like peptidase domain-containing protein [Gaiellaceae bacterium]